MKTSVVTIRARHMEYIDDTNKVPAINPEAVRRSLNKRKHLEHEAEYAIEICHSDFSNKFQSNVNPSLHHLIKHLQIKLPRNLHDFFEVM